MNLTPNPELKVGDTVFAWSAVLGDDKVTVSYKVTKITSNSFTTDDGTRWTVSKWGSGLKDNSWAKWGTGEYGRGTYIRRTPADGQRVMTMEALVEARHELMCHQEAARRNEMRAMANAGIGQAISELVKKNGRNFGLYTDLRSLREALTEDELPKYVEALERTLQDVSRTAYEQSARMQSFGEQIANIGKEMRF